MTAPSPVAIFLDFDGVIVESVEIKTRAFRKLFADSPEHLDDIVALHRANGGVSRYEKFRVIYRDFLRQPCGEEQMRRLGARFSVLVMEEVIRCPFVRGAEQFLTQFGARYALFLVSGTPQNELKEVVRRRGLLGHFHELYGSPRTKVEIMQGILTTYQWRPDQVVAIGDSLTDYAAAHSLGIPFIGRRGGEAEDSLMTTANEVQTVADLEELAQRWEELLERKRGVAAGPSVWTEGATRSSSGAAQRQMGGVRGDDVS